MIEIPPKFAGKSPINPSFVSEQRLLKDVRGARGLAEDVRYYGQWMRTGGKAHRPSVPADRSDEGAGERSSQSCKPLIGQKLTVIAWLWAARWQVPTRRSAVRKFRWFRRTCCPPSRAKNAYVHPVVEQGRYHFTVRTGTPPDPASAKTVPSSHAANSSVSCPGPPFHDSSRQKGWRTDVARLMAVVGGQRGRIYLSPTAEQESIARQASLWRPEHRFLQYEGFKTPRLWDFTPRHLFTVDSLWR